MTADLVQRIDAALERDDLLPEVAKLLEGARVALPTAAVVRDAAWLAKLARSSSWPLDMAEHVERSAAAVAAWADRLLEATQ